MSQSLAHYTCYRASGAIRVDGKLDEASWLAAPRSKPFVDIVTGEPAWFDTRVSILWDDQFLYFGFWAEETDVWASLTERDSRIYEDNDLEIFVDGDREAYYEFEMNALNTVYEVFWVWKDTLLPGSRFYANPEWDPANHRILMLSGVGGHVHERGERYGFLDWDFPGLKHAVHINGVLNSRTHTDKGWTAEIAFPWEGFRPLHPNRNLPPRSGDTWRIDCSRFQQFSKDGRRLDHSPGWTWNRHGHYDSHIPETFTYVHFSETPVTEAAGKD
jgi:hypothetical protein